MSEGPVSSFGEGAPMPRDWPEDFARENGQYECSCIFCHETFKGHKRRVCCRLCEILKSEPEMLASSGAGEASTAIPSPREPTPLCTLCGEPMPEGETMFFYHGYSGPCPKPPLAPKVTPKRILSVMADGLIVTHDDATEQEIDAALQRIRQFDASDSLPVPGIDSEQDVERWASARRASSPSEPPTLEFQRDEFPNIPLGAGEASPTSHYCGKGLPLEFRRVGPCPQCQAEYAKKNEESAEEASQATDAMPLEDLTPDDVDDLRRQLHLLADRTAMQDKPYLLARSIRMRKLANDLPHYIKAIPALASSRRELEEARADLERERFDNTHNKTLLKEYGKKLRAEEIRCESLRSTLSGLREAVEALPRCDVHDVSGIYRCVEVAAVLALLDRSSPTTPEK